MSTRQGYCYLCHQQFDSWDQFTAHHQNAHGLGATLEAPVDRFGTPVSIPGGVASNQLPPGDLRFKKILDEMWALHQSKSQGYGEDDDPLANIRASEDFEVPGWKGALIRGADKWRRIRKQARGMTIPFESLRDALIDFACYLIISVVLLDEEKK